MEEIGRRIRKLREAKRWTLEETGSKAGIHLSHLQKIEIGERGGSLPVLKKIAKVLGVTLAYLLGDEETPPSPMRIRHIPLVSRVPAGDPKDYTDRDYPTGWADEFVPCPEDVNDRSAFALKVEGESMAPLFKEGDILIVAPNEELKDGAPVVYRLKDETCTVKNYHQGENQEVILCPENLKTGGVQVFKPKDFRWIYRVVKAIKDV